MVDIIANMTWKNPIFMLVFFGCLWFLPGLLLTIRNNNIKEKRYKEDQENRISRLYPSEKQSENK